MYFAIITFSHIIQVTFFIKIWLQVMYFYWKRLCILIVVSVFLLLVYVFLSLSIYSYTRLPSLRFFRAFSSVVRQMPRYNQPRRGTAHTLPNCCVVLYIVCFVSFCVLFVCKCVLYYCHPIAVNNYINMSICRQLVSTCSLTPLIQ